MRTRIHLAWLLALACAPASPSRSSRAPTQPPGPISSSAVAVSPDGTLIAAVNPDSNSITLVKARTLARIAEIPVGGDPRTLCFSPDSKTIAVAGRGSESVSLISLPAHKESRRVRTGAMPYGVAMDERRLFVSEFAMGAIAVVDLASGLVVARVAVGAYPAGLALTADRRSLLITHFFSGRLTLIDLKTLSVHGVVESDSRANLSQFVAISPDGRRAYLPQTLSNTGAATLDFDTTLIPVVNIIDLSSMALLGRERLFLGSLHSGANRPFSAAVSANGRHLYVVNAGSDDVTVTELSSGKLLARVGVGANPWGLALSPDGTRVYVNNVLDGTLSAIRVAGDGEMMVHRPVAVREGMRNRRFLKPVDFGRAISCATCHPGSSASPLGPDTLVELYAGKLHFINSAWIVDKTVTLTKIPLPPAVLQGKRLFNSAAKPEMSFARWVSCASCHPDGAADGRTWPTPNGPRNTPALLGAGETPPYHWSGEFDELQDTELVIRSIQGGRGTRSTELDALAAYVESLPARPSPHRADKEGLVRGAAVFDGQGCRTCHALPAYTDRAFHAGVGDPTKEKNVRGLSFDTPSLRGLWFSAPYFHDGSAATLEDVLRTGKDHGISGRISEEERRNLVGYLRSL